MPVKGTLTLPGDKSISHRSVMLASLSDQRSKISNLSNGKDVKSTILCLKNCGIDIDYSSKSHFIRGGRFKQPIVDLDCGNSGTTARLLSGILVGQNFSSILDGDNSLRRRPMKRIEEPLRTMKADISTNNGCLPIEIKPSSLQGGEFNLNLVNHPD